MNEFCLIPSRAQVRAKLARASGDLAHYWQWMRRCARHAPHRYPWYHPFCAVATEEPFFAEQAREVLLRFAAGLPERDPTIYVQYHHWASSAPVARYGVYYDWVADAAPFTGDEHRLIRGALLDYGVKHTLPALQVKSHHDTSNQTLALALAAVMIGWVFGRRRGDSPAGAALLEYGLGRLVQLMDQLPVGGYNGEGSSYMQVVHGPGVVFAAKLLEEITGDQWMRRPSSATGVAPRDLLRMAAREVTPGGMLLPWDSHGISPVQNFLLYTTLAAETGDAAWLGLARQSHGWGYEDNMLWGLDDKVWALLWWPDELAPAPMAFHPWMEPAVAGAVVSRDARIHVVQAWDECGGQGIRSIRAHANPNTLLIEAHGVPLTVDGKSNGDCPAMVFAGCQRVESFYGIPKHQDWSHGTVGAHNGLVIDGDDGYTPDAAMHGLGGCHAELPGFQVVSGDVTACYRAGYAATRVIRSTMLLDERTLVVTDTADFPAPHSVTWRAYVRPEVHSDGRVASVVTAERLRACIRPLDPARITVTDLPGFPNTLERRSARVDLTYAPAPAHRLTTVISCEQGWTVIEELGEGWTFTADPDDRGVAEGWGASPEQLPAGPPIAADEPWPAYGGDPDSEVGWYARTVHLDAGAMPDRLRLHRYRGEGYRVWWDGQEMPITGVPAVAPYICLPAQTAPGAHRLAIRACHDGMTAPSPRRTFWGAPALERAAAPAPAPSVTRVAEHWLAVVERCVVHDNHRHAHLARGDWRTDAAFALLAAPDRYAVADATFLHCAGEMRLNAGAPASLAVEGQAVTIGALAGGHTVTVWLPTLTLRCTHVGAGGIHATAVGDGAVSLALTGALRGAELRLNGVRHSGGAVSGPAQPCDPGAPARLAGGDADQRRTRRWRWRRRAIRRVWRHCSPGSMTRRGPCNRPAPGRSGGAATPRRWTGCWTACPARRRSKSIPIPVKAMSSGRDSWWAWARRRRCPPDAPRPIRWPANAGGSRSSWSRRWAGCATRAPRRRSRRYWRRRTMPSPCWPPPRTRWGASAIRAPSRRWRSAAPPTKPAPGGPRATPTLSSPDARGRRGRR
ncbi:MAG TPA: hypothetical protein PK794_01275, partial [Armatimonadota bacterium]|nr:hypothetical protein [Armatimonadota bacterium]